VFNNVVAVVASDAAKEGLNWGNAGECIEYDVPQSPMDEYQRIARSARMLPKVVADKLMGTPKNPGPFAKIRAQERALFKTARAHGPEGFIAKSTVMGEAFKRPMGVEQALDIVALRAAAGATTATSREDIRLWDAIRGRADSARTFGAQEALAALQEFRTTRIPNTNTPVISYNDKDVKIPSPLEGTYDTVVADDAAEAIQRAIDALLDKDRALVAKAGYTDTDGGWDGTRVYLALRADEILSDIKKRRPEVERELRGSPVGSAVTDKDIENRLMDERTPEERAILKTMKYLVNVYRVTPSVTTPRFQKLKVDVGGTTETERVFVGYEKQFPILPEAMARGVGRSRSVPVESLMRRISEGVKPRTAMHYSPMISETASQMSVSKARPAVRI